MLRIDTLTTTVYVCETFAKRSRNVRGTFAKRLSCTPKTRPLAKVEKSVNFFQQGGQE